MGPLMKPPKVIVGIDPGKSGGLACIALDEVSVEPMPEEIADLFSWFYWWSGRKDVLIFMEQVGGFIGSRTADDGGHGDGKKRNIASGHTMFEFGRGVGHIEMAIEATGLTSVVTRLHPRKWQAGLGIEHKSRGETQTSFKNRIKDKAVKLFPKIHITLKTADALLIAEYGRGCYEIGK